MNWPSIIAAEMILASAVTFVMYGWDKRVARLNRTSNVNRTSNANQNRGDPNEPTSNSRSNSRPRIPEKTLLGACLIGGWPGGLIASRVFRHKTSKRSYRAKFILVTILNVATVAAILYWR